MDVWSALVGYDLEYVRRGAGRFGARFRMRRGDDLRVVDQSCNRKVSVVGHQQQDFVSAFITRNPHEKGIFCGKKLGKHSVTILPPRVEASYRAPADLRMLSILLPAERLRKALELAGGYDFDTVLSATRVVSVPDRVLNRLIQISGLVLDSPTHPLKPTRPTVWIRELEEHFLTLLTDSLTVSEKLFSERALESHLQYVIKAREYIAASLDLPLGLETLAREVGASPRTLEYAFRDVLGVSPLRYVKLCRLQAARDLLKSANYTVTETALRCGFDHLSYFARDFKALFGELPSETLRGEKC